MVNVQQSTIRKISDFFGVSYKEIETISFEEREIIENDVSLVGNMNPAAVPVIMERLLIQSLDKRIGELATIYPLTYYFGSACNVIGVLLENEVSGVYERGDLLIIKKGLSSSNREKLVYEKKTRKLFMCRDALFDAEVFCAIGDILEERYNG